MKSEFRYSDEEWEYRASDNGLGSVSGIIVRTGDVAQVGLGLTEQIEEGAFDLAPRWWANRMHQRPNILGVTGQNLTLLPAKDALRFRLDLPSTQLGRDTAYELDKGFLRGASVELGTVTARYQGAHRFITKSTAIRFALVDKPAYPDSLLKLNRWEDWEGYQNEEEPESTRRYFFLPAWLRSRQF